MANANQQRSQQLAASPQLFDSAFLNFFSRVHPSIPAIVFVPVVVIMEWLGADRGLAALELIALTIGGLGIWTLTEYWLHRLFFHWEPDNDAGRRMHFIIHGVHHDHPNDRLRLVMPPAVSIPLAALFFLGFSALFGTPAAYPLFAGFITGYLGYDYMHYHVHHHTPKTKLGKQLAASSTCATTSRTTDSDSASPHRSGTSSSAPCPVSVRTPNRLNRSVGRPARQGYGVAGCRAGLPADP
jgi:Fatty acid hydroxylase superfamily.